MNPITSFSNLLYCIQQAILFPFRYLLVDMIAAPILKACVFQEAAFQEGCISRNVFMPLARTILNIWQRTQGIKDLRSSFDISRFSQSREFINEFAEEKSITTADGNAITYMVFRPERFRSWILDNGGKITNKSDHVLIEAQDDVAWGALQRLREFRCFEEVNHSFKIPKNISGANKKCILRCQGFGRQIPMDKKYIGKHLALGFNYAVFNWRKNVSLPNFFKDAEAVYNALITKEGFSFTQLIAKGSCRATFVVSHLKEKYHANGLDAVLIQSGTFIKNYYQC